MSEVTVTARRRVGAPTSVFYRIEVDGVHLLSLRVGTRLKVHDLLPRQREVCVVSQNDRDSWTVPCSRHHLENKLTAAKVRAITTPLEEIPEDGS